MFEKKTFCPVCSKRRIKVFLEKTSINVYKLENQEFLRCNLCSGLFIEASKISDLRSEERISLTRIKRRKPYRVELDLP